VKLNVKTCQNEFFQKKNSEVKRSKNNYCSRTCAGKGKQVRFCKVCGKKTNNKYCDKHTIIVNNAVIITPCKRTLSKHNKLGCHLVKILRRLTVVPNKAEINKHVSLYPANYFLKVLYHKDPEYINYLKGRIKSMLKNTYNRVEFLYKKHGIVDHNLNSDFLYDLWFKTKS
jgi:hypothetical protein